jgi:hypothetical protein
MMIAFYNGTNGELIGVANEKDGKYTSESEFISQIISSATDSKEFVERYSNWSNGYMFSVELKEGEDPESPDFLKDPQPEPKSWTAEEVKKAQEREADASES